MDHGSLGKSFSTRVHWRVGASGSADSIPENAVPQRGHHNVWPVIIRHPLSWCWWLKMPPFPAAPCGPGCPAGGGFRPKRRPRSWSRGSPAVMGKVLTLVWAVDPSGIKTLLPPSLTSNLKDIQSDTGLSHRKWRETTWTQPGHKGRPAPLDPSLPVLPTPCPRPGPMLGDRSRDLSRRLYWMVVHCYCKWQILLLGHCGCRVRPVTGVTGVRWAATDWDWANFIRSINILMVNLGSDACCPGAAAGWFMIGTWGTNTDWVGRFIPTTWKYVPSWSTNVLGFHNTGFMSWAWSWFTRWGPSWSTGGNASPRVRHNPRLSSSPGAVATPWWPIIGG